MKAALSARQDKNLVIAGRTSALAIADVDEAVKRAKAYEAAGVDAVFLAGGVTVEAVEVVSSAIRIPLILGGGGGQLGDLGLAGGASGSGRAADPRTVFGRGAGRLRHIEGVARRRAAARAEEHRLARIDAAGHPRRRLPALDQGFSRRCMSRLEAELACELPSTAQQEIAHRAFDPRCSSCLLWRRRLVRTTPAIVAGDACG